MVVRTLTFDAVHNLARGIAPADGIGQLSRPGEAAGEFPEGRMGSHEERKRVHHHRRHRRHSTVKPFASSDGACAMIRVDALRLRGLERFSATLAALFRRVSDELSRARDLYFDDGSAGVPGLPERCGHARGCGSGGRGRGGGAGRSLSRNRWRGTGGGLLCGPTGGGDRSTRASPDLLHHGAGD